MSVTIETSPAVFGLTAQTASTAFGTLYFVGPARRSSREAILFLHGFGSTWTVWTPVLEAGRRQGWLAGRDAILVDLPGFGRSENQLGHLNSKPVGRELLGLMKRLGYTRVRVAGHSMGGFLTLDMAASHSAAEIASVHIVAGSYFSLLRTVNNPVKSFFRSPAAALFYGAQRLLLQRPAIAGALNRLRALAPSAHGQPLYTLGGPSFDYAAQNGRGYDAHHQWGRIAMPVYGVFGARDKLVSARDMNELQQVLPAAHLTLIPAAGHSVLVTRAAETAAALFGDLPTPKSPQ